jgi:hypothetical protein
MAYTTLNAIKAAIENLIQSLDPVGDPMGNGKYARTGDHFSWDDKPNAQFDRRFTAGDIDRGTPTMFGSIAEIDYAGSIRIRIGHAYSSDMRAGDRRRDTDLAQIQQALEKKNNFPSGVSLVRFDGQVVSDRNVSKHWISTLSFEIHFALQAP